MLHPLQSQMIKTELVDITGGRYVLTDQADLMIYGVDYMWVPRMWIDRGMVPPIPDFVVLPETPEQVSAIIKAANVHSIPVIPWGFGKWMGKRGDVLNRLIESAKNPYFYIGDNGNRPFFLTDPAQFKLAQNKDIRNLPGSDPLPLPSEVNKPGRWGFSISEHMDKSNPAAHLKEFIF